MFPFFKIEASSFFVTFFLRNLSFLQKKPIEITTSLQSHYTQTNKKIKNGKEKREKSCSVFSVKSPTQINPLATPLLNFFNPFTPKTHS